MKVINTGLEHKSQELVGLKLALKALWHVNQHYQVKERGIMMLLICFCPFSLIFYLATDVHMAWCRCSDPTCKLARN